MLETNPHWISRSLHRSSEINFVEAHEGLELLREELHVLSHGVVAAGGEDAELHQVALGHRLQIISDRPRPAYNMQYADNLKRIKCLIQPILKTLLTVTLIRPFLKIEPRLMYSYSSLENHIKFDFLLRMLNLTRLKF